MNIRYELEKAKKEDRELLLKYKLANIVNFSHNLSPEEIIEINDYVEKSISEQIDSYKIIKIDNKKIGCLLLEKYQDGILLDEIYLESDYQKKGIGTDILTNVLNNNSKVYLWVYKENEVALNLYKKLGFIITDVTESRYFMEYKNKKDQ